MYFWSFVMSRFAFFVTCWTFMQHRCSLHPKRCYPKRFIWGVSHGSRWCHAPLVLGTNARHAKGSESDRWIPREGGKLGGYKVGLYLGMLIPPLLAGMLIIGIHLPLIWKSRLGGFQLIETESQWLFFSGCLSIWSWTLIYLGGGFKYSYFHPYLGKWSNLTNVFQRGWNHQLDRLFKGVCDDSPNLP